ncbi:amino acid permease, partial [Candidatus Saccharibacteria bacterium]|nr:amino acid permease [Candidatus Saccharibacteria bacterium]
MSKNEKVKLRRSLGLSLVSLYGLGNILGAGIYVLVGKVAEAAGTSTTLAFLGAMVLASITAFSYMELSGRYPISAGVSIYLHKAFGKKWLSLSTGLILVGAGVASAAALAQGFAGYLSELAPVPVWLASVGLIVVLGVVAMKGIGESAKTAAAFTAVEVLGLLLVIWFGRHAFSTVDTHTLLSLDPQLGFAGLVAGTFLAFYAFIGFEDMVNVAEEVKNPRRTMPFAILISLAAATILYLLVVVVATNLVPTSELAESKAPLSLVLGASGVANAHLLSVIGMVATMNGVIVQIIMGSRILYGLSNQGWLTPKLAVVSNKTNTPIVATLVVLAAMVAATLLLPLVSLAKLTSLLILIIFVFVNVSLIVVKRRQPKGSSSITVWPALPYVGAVMSALVILYQLVSWSVL